MVDWSNEEECLEAVIQDAWALYYVKTQTEEMCLESVRRWSWTLGHVKNPTKEMVLIACDKGECPAFTYPYALFRKYKEIVYG